MVTGFFLHGKGLAKEKAELGPFHVTVKHIGSLEERWKNMWKEVG
jgi:hypothetical protein